MLEALSDFISKVTRGEKIRIGGKEAQWKKVSELKEGMLIAVPKDEALRDYQYRHCEERLRCKRSDEAISKNDGMRLPRPFGVRNDKNNHGTIEQLNNDVLWDEIVSIRRLSPERVWDLEVEGTHNFVAGHLIDMPLTDTERLINEEPLRGPPFKKFEIRNSKFEIPRKWYGGIFAHNTAIFGAGEGGTPTATTIRGAGAAGTNVAGANFTFDASNGTGSGGSGAWIFRTAPPGASGTSADTLAEALRITNTGLLGVGTAAPLSRLQVTNNPTGSATTGKAALIVDQYETQDLITASASGTTKFYVSNSGDVVGQRFVDLANSAYLLDPANTGVSLNVAGRIISNSAYNESGTWSTIVLKGSNDTTSTSVCIEGTATNATTCDGKVDAGTFDPPYTINGKHYATYAPSMTGVKEETTGTVITRELVPDVGYRSVINFGSQPEGSDSWLFARATNLKQQFDKLVVLLSPAGNTRTWYTVDPASLSLSIYSSAPATISYRLTAPRFDSANWSNRRKDQISGFKIDDHSPWPLTTNASGNIANLPSLNNSTITTTQSAGGQTNYQVRTGTNPVDEFLASANAVLGHLKSGLIEAQQVSAGTITIAGQSLSDYIRSVVKQTIIEGLNPGNPGNQGLTLTQNVVSPIAEIKELSTNTISPLSSQASQSAGLAVKLGDRQTFGIYNQEGTPAATFDNLGNATVAGTLSASVLRSNEVATNELTAHDATIAGTLYADRIIQTSQPVASATTTIKNEYITNIVNLVASSSATFNQQPIVDATSSALLALLANGGDVSPPINHLASTSGTIFIPNDLTVLGNTTLGSTTITENLSVAGQIMAGPEGISTPGYTLYLEKSKLAAVDILAGTLVVNPAGNVMVNGDMIVSGNVAITGVLGVDTITPLSGNQLVFDLGRTDQASGSSEASGSGMPRSKFGQLVVKGLDGKTVAKFDASGSAEFAGDVVASGSGTFRKIVIPSEVEGSPVSTSSATINNSIGTSILPAGATEVTIPTTQVTDKSLIYITPVTSTNNEVLYIKNHISGNSFTVGLDIALPTAVKFNWWVVN